MKFVPARNLPSPLLSGHGFLQFYEHHSRQLLRYFARRTYDAEAAFDLTAETFAEAFRSRRRFRGESHDEQAAWLYAIARHQLHRYFRRGKAERKALERVGIALPEPSPAELERVEEMADLPAVRAELIRGLATISADQRRAVRLRVIDELPYPEVATRLGVSEPTARARVSRGLRRLAETLERPPIPKERTL